MNPRETILSHLSLCESVHQVLLEENTWLKTNRSQASPEILEKKKNLLPLLDSSLAELKKLKPEYFSPFDDTKKLVSDSHSKLLQIFYLDRENEELLLKMSQSVERQTFNRFTKTAEEIEEIHDTISSVGENQEKADLLSEVDDEIDEGISR